MINLFFALLSSMILITIEIGLLAFIVTIIVITVAVIVKIIKNKKLPKSTS